MLLLSWNIFKGLFDSKLNPWFGEKITAAIKNSVLPGGEVSHEHRCCLSSISLAASYAFGRLYTSVLSRGNICT
jgi:hypothetical protein